jgi:hypothetical protein
MGSPGISRGWQESRTFNHKAPTRQPSWGRAFSGSVRVSAYHPLRRGHARAVSKLILCGTVAHRIHTSKMPMSRDIHLVSLASELVSLASELVSLASEPNLKNSFR